MKKSHGMPSEIFGYGVLFSHIADLTNIQRDMTDPKYSKIISEGKKFLIDIQKYSGFLIGKNELVGYRISDMPLLSEIYVLFGKILLDGNPHAQEIWEKAKSLETALELMKTSEESRTEVNDSFSRLSDESYLRISQD